jgi:hypothetical protein
MRTALAHQNPLHAIALPRSQSGPLTGATASLLSIDNDDVVITAFKPAEDDDAGYVVRLWELAGTSASVNIDVSYMNPARAWHTSLIEADVAEATLSSGVISVSVDAHEIEALRVGEDPILVSTFESRDTSDWSSTRGSGLAVSTSAASLGTHGLEVTLGSSCTSPTRVDLSGETISGPLTVEACDSIIAADGYVIADGGDVVFTAGRLIRLKNGFSVESGGSLTAGFNPSIYPFGYVQDDSPQSDTRYNARFFVNLDDLTIGGPDELEHFVAYAAGEEPQLRIVVQSGPTVILEARDDAGVFHATAGLAVPAGWNRITLGWEASSSATIWMSVNNGSPQELTGLDTDQRRIDFVRWGLVSGDASGSSGSIAQDEFRSWR